MKKSKQKENKIEPKGYIGLIFQIFNTIKTIKKEGMKKDTVRTILTLIATLIATFFGVDGVILNESIDLVVVIVTAAIALYNTVMSIIRPADDIIPEDVQRELNVLRASRVVK